ncbi:MAG: DUF1376 domain-containing protein [Aquincola tertiaricarbonis]
MNDALPDPLVPAEVDLRDFQYMELDVRVLRDSRFGAEVSGDAFRAGVMLWCAAWHQVPAGSVPDDDIELANLAGYGRFVKEWRKSRAQALQGFVKCSDGRLYHAMVCEKAQAAWTSKLQHHFERAKDRLRKANKARAAANQPALAEFTFDQWNEQRLSRGVPMEKAEASAGIPQNVPAAGGGIPAENALRGNGEGKGEGEGEGEGTECIGVGGPTPPAPPAPAPPAALAAATPPPPDPPPAPPESRGTRLPKDWQLPKAWGDWALAEYPQWTADKVRREGASFRDHWVAKTKDAAKLDWLATWRNWCRSDIAHRDDPKPRPPAPAQADTETRNAEAKKLLGFTSKPEELPHA